MAASVLQQQLQAVQQQQQRAPVPAKKPKGKPSLLWDPIKANDVDLETIYDVGLQGMAELCRLNPAFGALREALFSRAAASFSRDQQQPEALQQLDAAVHEFCSLLTQHFLSAGAFKALEYLIRRFKVNEHNVSSLVLAGLPYHATNEFVLLLQTLALDPKRGLWAWLAPAQATGASVPRAVLVARCLNDPPVLRWICEAAKQLGTAPPSPAAAAADTAQQQPQQQGGRGSSRRSGGGVPAGAVGRGKLTSFLSFYAAVVCEVVMEAKALGDDHLSLLLPYISAGLEPSALPDYRAATLMLVGCVCSRAHLTKELCKALANSILVNHAAGLGQEATVLRVLAHAAVSQPHFAIPDKGIKALMQMPSVAQELASLQRHGARLQPLLQLLASSLVAKLPSAPERAAPQLLGLVQAGVLEPVAERLAAQLLQQACPEARPDLPTTTLPPEAVPAPVLEAATQLLRALDLRHPEQTDRAVNALLASGLGGAGKPSTRAQQRRDASDDDDEEEGADEEEAEEKQEQEARQRRRAAIFAVLQEVFANTTRLPCGKAEDLGSGTAAGSGGVLTLAAAASAPAAGVRILALQRMSELLELGGASDATQAQLTATVLRGFEDQDLEVTSAALSLPCLRRLPPAAVLQAALPAILRASAALFFPSTPAPVGNDDATGSAGASTGGGKPGEPSSLSSSPSASTARHKQARVALRRALQLLGALASALDEGGGGSAAVRQQAADAATLLALQCLLPARHAAKLPAAAADLAQALAEASMLNPLLRHVAGTVAQPAAALANADADPPSGAAAAATPRSQHSTTAPASQASPAGKTGGKKSGKKGGKKGAAATDDADAEAPPAEDAEQQQQQPPQLTAEAKRAAREAKARRRDAAVHACARAVVEAVGRALADGLDHEPGPTNTEDELLRLLALSKSFEAEYGGGGEAGGGALLRARHLLALAVRAALVRALLRRRSAAAAARAADQLSQLQLRVALSELSGPAAGGGERRRRRGSKRRDGEEGEEEEEEEERWRETAAACVDASGDGGAPSAAHAALLLARPRAVHRATLRQALLASIDALPVGAVQALGEGPAAPMQVDAAAATTPASAELDLGVTFRQVAALQPAGGFDAHLSLLLDKACAAAGGDAAGLRLTFLASVFASPELLGLGGGHGGGGLTAEAEAALRLAGGFAAAALQPAQQHSGTPARHAGKGSGGAAAATAADTAAAVLAHVPHLVAAAGAPGAALRGLRSAAAAAVKEAAAALAAVPAAVSAAAAPTGRLLLAAFAPQAAWVTSDPHAAASLLAAALHGKPSSGALPMAATATTTGTPTKAGRGSGRAQAPSTPEPGAGPAVAPQDAQAATTAFLQLLPALCSAPHNLAAAYTLVEGVAPHAEASTQPAPSRELRQASAALLARVLAAAPLPLTPMQGLLAARLAPLAFSPAPLPPDAPAGNGSGSFPPPSLQLLLSSLASSAASPTAPASAPPAWFESTAPLRLAALRCLASGALPPLLSLGAPAAATTARSKPASASQQQPLAGEAAVPLELVRALAAGAASDGDAACREAARSALEALPVAAEHVVPVLEAAAAQHAQHAAEAAAAAAATASAAEADAAAAGGKRKKRKALAAQQQQQQQQQQQVLELRPPGMLDQAVLLLEMLQWKHVSGETQVVAASQQLLSALQPTIASIAVPHGADPQREEPEDDDDVRPELTATATASALAGYAAQLVLTWLAAAARRLLASPSGPPAAATAAASPAGVKGARKGGGGGKRESSGRAEDAAGEGVGGVFDLALVVRVAREAPDGLARNAALGLLSLLAGLAPRQALDHALQVLALAHASATHADDAHSLEVATTAVQSVVPAWLSSGQPPHQLWRAAAPSLAAMAPHRRLALLSAMLTAARAAAAAEAAAGRRQDEEGALTACLEVLLARAAEVMEGRRPSAAADVAAGRGRRKGGAAAAAAAGVEVTEDVWLLELGGQLASQVPLAERLEAFAQLLRRTVQEAGGHAHALLPRLAVTFVTTQLQARSVVSSSHEHQQDASLVPASEALMVAALDAVQTLTSSASDAAHAPAAGGKPPRGQQQQRAAGNARVEGAVRASIKGLYALFESLQAVMAPHSYLEALMRLATSPRADDRARRRALRLFAARAARLPDDLHRVAQHPALNKKQRATQAQQLAAAALKIVPVVQALAKGLPAAAEDGGDAKQLEEAASALTHQAALAALASVAAAFGTSHAAELAAAVPAALAHARRHGAAAVRGGALAAVAAVAGACGGAALLPQLPHVAAAVLGACEAAAQRLPAPGAQTLTPDAAAPATTTKRGKKRATADDDDASDASDDASDDEDEREERRQREAAEAGGGAASQQLAAVELTAGLAAVSALVRTQGAFLSPYLPALLRVALHPRVLAQPATVAPLAERLRAALPEHVPSRLLLPALYNALQPAAEAGLAPTQALLALVAASALRLDAAAAAAGADAMLAFLLRALDLRSAPPPALLGAEHQAEQAAVAALCALTLKLSETKFKPLFLRVLEWAAGAPAGSYASIARLTALFSVAAALAEKLRSLFVPYYRHLVDLAVKHLAIAASATTAGSSGKKKGKRAREEAGAAEAEAGASEEPRMVAARWVLRGKVLRALHRCFLYDSIGWLDAAKVGALLPALVEQLRAPAPAAAAAAALAAQCGDAELDASVALADRSAARLAGEGLEHGRAAVAALVALAVAANSDVHWKPLNHQVLMAARSGGVRARVLALEVLHHLADRLREEYLVLLPETLPVLAELLEDTDVAVESRAQQVLALLEEVGGEKLEPYLKA